MSLSLRRAVRGVLLSSMMLPMHAALAVPCDLLDSITNIQGALVLVGYQTDGGVVSTQRLLALRGDPPAEKCQATVEVDSMAPLVTPTYRDGITLQRIAPTGDYTATLAVEAPDMPGNTQPRSFVFEQIDFSPDSFGVMENARLQLAFSVTGGSSAWYLNSRLLHGADPEAPTVVPLVTTWPLNPSLGNARRYWIRITYVATTRVLRVAQLSYGDGFVGTEIAQQIVLPVSVRPTLRSQGLVAQTNVPTGLTFKLHNSFDKPTF